MTKKEEAKAQIKPSRKAKTGKERIKDAKAMVKQAIEKPLDLSKLADIEKELDKSGITALLSHLGTSVNITAEDRKIFKLLDTSALAVPTMSKKQIERAIMGEELNHLSDVVTWALENPALAYGSVYALMCSTFDTRLQDRPRKAARILCTSLGAYCAIKAKKIAIEARREDFTLNYTIKYDAMELGHGNTAKISTRNGRLYFDLNSGATIPFRLWLQMHEEDYIDPRPSIQASGVSPWFSVLGSHRVQAQRPDELLAYMICASSDLLGMEE